MTTVTYRSQLFDHCVALMSDTWNFNELFPELAKDNLINELFFREVLAGADYSELILDEDGKVRGYLFGMLRSDPVIRLRRALRTIRFLARLTYHYLLGHFGPRPWARRRAAELASLSAILDGKKRANDGYVSLYFVGSDLRGQGWGKRLMSSFERRCRELGRDRVYLWTDKGCNYGFYDHYGFHRIEEVSSPLLAHYGSGPNGFVYVKALTPGPTGAPETAIDRPGPAPTRRLNEKLVQRIPPSAQNHAKRCHSEPLQHPQHHEQGNGDAGAGYRSPAVPAVPAGFESAAGGTHGLLRGGFQVYLLHGVIERDVYCYRGYLDAGEVSHHGHYQGSAKDRREGADTEGPGSQQQERRPRPHKYE